MEKRIKSPQDLKNLRDRARADVELRGREKELRITVHMGTCGIAAGARDVLGFLMDELARIPFKNVTVKLSGCLGLCDQEPMFTLTDRAGNEFCYGKLSQARVHEIVEQHVVGNKPVAEYVVTT
jgi:NADP-reducing hydrogenase subunit HndB